MSNNKSCNRLELKELIYFIQHDNFYFSPSNRIICKRSLVIQSDQVNYILYKKRLWKEDLILQDYFNFEQNLFTRKETNDIQQNSKHGFEKKCEHLFRRTKIMLYNHRFMLFSHFSQACILKSYSSLIQKIDRF